jgi:EAL domain-containing protein (putative c-di-GMP-specific phosphodiesterase class I)/CheY-like chemotaxis protein
MEGKRLTDERSQPMTGDTEGRTPAAHPAVLLVDDDSDLLALMALALRRAGLTTIVANNGEAALELLAVEEVGCVVSDLGMSGMSGIQLVRALRAQPETATMPFLLITGTGDADSVIEALEAGADDFLSKPVRLDELVARVRAHLRTQSAWTDVVQAELHTRSETIKAIGALSVSSVPEIAAEAVVTELASRIGSHFVGVFRLAGEDRLEPMATWSTTDGLARGGPALPVARGRYLIDRVRQGPWAARLTGPEPGEAVETFWNAQPDLVAVAPIYAGDGLVGLLSIALVLEPSSTPIPILQARILAAAIDYASILGFVIGSSLVDRRKSSEEEAVLRRVLDESAFFPVFQPVVSLHSGLPVGYEALTRFTDGTPPADRFDRAAALGVGFEFELAAIDAAITAAPPMEPEQFLSLNVSPDLVMASTDRLRRSLAAWNGHTVLEVTEHARVPNYPAFREAVSRLGHVEVAIDDAGAGFASLQHILELAPAWVKLDISLVHDIDADPMRQALVAGLAFFAQRSGQRLVAEGVERQEEADALMVTGVEFAQGHLFGRPSRTGHEDADPLPSG